MKIAKLMKSKIPLTIGKSWNFDFLGYKPEMSRWSETPTDWLSRGDKKHNNKTTKDNDLTASKVTCCEHYPAQGSKLC